MALLTRPPSSPPEVEVLIKEARGLRRRRWVLGTITAILVVSVVITASIVASSGSHQLTRPSPQRYVPPIHSAAIGHILNASSLGTGTTIVAGSMLTGSTGFALAASPLTTTGYLVETLDSGHSWLVRGIVPFSMARYGYLLPSVHFVNRSLGYVESGDDAVYVTKDGGKSWVRLEVPSTGAAFLDNPQWRLPPTYVVTDGMFFLIGGACGSTTSCSPIVAEFALGATRPARLVEPGRLRLSSAAPLLLSSPTPGAIVVAQGPWINGSALYVSLDNGSTWSRGMVPCGPDSGISSIVAARGGTWLLSCFRGEGMMQGLSQVWRSSDSGITWQPAAVGNEGGRLRTFGGLPDVGAQLGSSRDRHLVWGLLGGAAGGLILSTDGGYRWSLLNQHTGEMWDTLTAAGPHGAVVFTPGAALWTTDGRHFTPRRLPTR